VIEEAASLFESLAQNHLFVDGNKRTAFIATAVFLTLNGLEMTFDDARAYDWLIELFKTHRLTQAEVDSWLRRHILPPSIYLPPPSPAALCRSLPLSHFSRAIHDSFRVTDPR